MDGAVNEVVFKIIAALGFKFSLTGKDLLFIYRKKVFINIRNGPNNFMVVLYIGSCCVLMFRWVATGISATPGRAKGNLHFLLVNISYNQQNDNQSDK